MTHDLAAVKEFADRAIVLKVLGRRNGLTQEEIVEAITHLAFHTGWPRAFRPSPRPRSCSPWMP